MKRTATKLTKETRDGKLIHCVQWPRLPKGRNREYFRDKREAEIFLKQKLAEQANYGVEGMAFNLRQRAECLECIERLAPFKATLRDAVDFYLPHLEATNRSCTAKQLVDEIVAAKKADGASHRYIKDLNSRLNHFAATFNGRLISTITTTPRPSRCRFNCSSSRTYVALPSAVLPQMLAPRRGGDFAV
jgi:hypothetical protein